MDVRSGRKQRGEYQWVGKKQKSPKRKTLFLDAICIEWKRAGVLSTGGQHQAVHGEGGWGTQLLIRWIFAANFASFTGVLASPVCTQPVPQTTFPPGVTKPNSLTFTSIMDPFVITPKLVNKGECGFFFTPIISKQKVVFNLGWVTCAFFHS